MTDVADQPKPAKPNPLLTRRMVNAYARLSGCREADPTAKCDHRIIARRTLEELVGLFAAERE